MLSEEQLESGAVTKRGIEIVRGDGSRIWDSNGKEYIDMGASYGVCNVGHCNPYVIEAVQKQLSELIYVSSSYDNPARRELMERLIEISPSGMARVFLCNSGTEAVETALKFTLKHTGRTKVVAAKRAFHGRTLGSLSMTFNPSHREGVSDKLFPVDFVTFGNAGELNDIVTEETAAVVLEPIQGEGGVHLPPEGYFKEARRICDEKGALLIVDEVQAGMCRTGKIFAIQHYEVTPDIICIGKSIAGGLPMGAAILHDKLGPMPKGSHGSTFGGNPLVCAAANGALRYMIDHDLSGRSETLGKRFLEGLRGIGSMQVREVRGMGLMIGVELKTRSGPYLSALLEKGIAAIPTGSTVIRFLPPLVVPGEEIDMTVKTFAEVLDG
ncbi:MAG: aminotransferase class III-fold pyridoxal phosphate-dependent enzyme [Candidatus Thermoplasmatota archaeon]|nr:aminotransferase class III-fold pyridoxal phosphate-dependent enzyme [Candidatus Thermoplasmatota archaeon]